MANLKISELPQYTGDTTGFQIVADNSSLTTTYRVTGEKVIKDVINVVANSGIEQTTSGSTIDLQTKYNTVLDPQLVTPSAVGGIPAGTPVSGLTTSSIVGIIDDLLFPTVNPTFVNPSYSLSINVATLQEIGATINPILTGTLIRGSIQQSWPTVGTQNFRSGTATGYTFTGYNALNVSQASPNTYTLSGLLIDQGYMTYNSSVGHGTGPQPINNKGVNYLAPYPSGTISSNSVTIEGVYPIYATTSTISAQTKQTLYSMITGNNIVLALVAEEPGQKQKFWVPTTWITSRPITQIQEYDTNSSQWITVSLSNYTETTTTISSISYKQYTYNGSNRGVMSIKIIF